MATKPKANSKPRKPKGKVAPKASKTTRVPKTPKAVKAPKAAKKEAAPKAPAPEAAPSTIFDTYDIRVLIDHTAQTGARSTTTPNSTLWADMMKLVHDLVSTATSLGHEDAVTLTPFARRPLYTAPAHRIEELAARRQISDGPCNTHLALDMVLSECPLLEDDRKKCVVCLTVNGFNLQTAVAAMIRYSPETMFVFVQLGESASALRHLAELENTQLPEAKNLKIFRDADAHASSLMALLVKAVDG